MSPWHRVSRRRPCPVCQHGDWCLISDDGAAAICPRVESDRRVGDAGWLHQLAEGRIDKNWTRRPRSIFIEGVVPDVSTMAKQCAIAGQVMLESLGTRLGLSADSLRRFGVGWLAAEACSTWPMYNAAGKVIGVNRRFADGSKKIVWGQKSGLYLPVDLPSDLSGLTLLVCEGATDTVAAADMGFWSIGRFNCDTGSKLIAELVKRRRPGLLVIAADADEQGRRGAESLASVILPYCASLKVIVPPVPHKDIRAWRQAGATPEELVQVIGAARPRRLGVEVRQR